MADIQLSRPAANQTQTISSAADARFVLNFATGEARLAKSDNGENLVMTFDDGAKIEVEGFYTTFNKDNLPTLNVGGQDISGEQLAAVLGEDLMPAAGPSAGQAAAQGGRFRSFADAALYDGIDRLGGLDIGFPDGAYQDETPYNYYAVEDTAATLPGGEEPTLAPEPTPTPGPIPTSPLGDDLKAQPDVYEGAIMNSVRINLVANDTLGSVAASDVSGISGDLGDTLFGNARLDGTTLEYRLDASKLAAAVKAAGDDPAGLTGSMAFAYTAQAGGLTDGATASITVGDHLARDNATLNANATDGADVAWARHNYGTISTGNGGDLVVVEVNKDGGLIDAGAGADTLHVGMTDAGATTRGGAGDDAMYIYYNDGLVQGNAGNESFTVKGGSGVFEGNTGEDSFLIQGGKKATIDGGEEGDRFTVDGGEGNTVLGGTGDDLFAVNAGTGNTIDGGGDADRFTVVGGTGNTINGGMGTDEFEVYAGTGNTIDGGGDADRFTVAGGTDNTINGGTGDDHIWVTAQPSAGLDGGTNNVYHGGDGNDHIKVNNVNVTGNTFYGDDGNDTIEATAGSNNAYYGGDGNDNFINAGGSDNKFYGDTGDDTMRVSGKSNLYEGGEDNDLFNVAYGATSVTVNGGVGDDVFVVTGGDGNTLDGGADNDTFDLHSGINSTYTGGAGNDLFVINANAVLTSNKEFDGGDDLDLLLTQWSTPQDVVDGLAALPTMTSMDAIVVKGASQFTGKSQGEVKEALHNVGVEWGDDADKFVFDGKLWSNEGTRDVQGVEYTQLTHVGDDISVLVATASLEFNS